MKCLGYERKTFTISLFMISILLSLTSLIFIISCFIYALLKRKYPGSKPLFTYIMVASLWLFSCLALHRKQVKTILYCKRFVTPTMIPIKILYKTGLLFLYIFYLHGIVLLDQKLEILNKYFKRYVLYVGIPFISVVLIGMATYFRCIYAEYSGMNNREYAVKYGRMLVNVSIWFDVFNAISMAVIVLCYRYIFKRVTLNNLLYDLTLKYILCALVTLNLVCFPRLIFEMYRLYFSSAKESVNNGQYHAYISQSMISLPILFGVISMNLQFQYLHKLYTVLCCCCIGILKGKEDGLDLVKVKSNETNTKSGDDSVTIQLMSVIDSDIRDIIDLEFIDIIQDFWIKNGEIIKSKISSIDIREDYEIIFNIIISLFDGLIVKQECAVVIREFIQNLKSNDDIFSGYIRNSNNYRNVIKGFHSMILNINVPYTIIVKYCIQHLLINVNNKMNNIDNVSTMIKCLANSDDMDNIKKLTLNELIEHEQYREFFHEYLIISPNNYVFFELLWKYKSTNNSDMINKKQIFNQICQYSIFGSKRFVINNIQTIRNNLSKNTDIKLIDMNNIIDALTKQILSRIKILHLGFITS